MNNEVIFVQKMHDFFLKYWKYVTWKELNEVVELFRILHRPKSEISDFIDLFINHNKDKPEKFNVREVFHFRSIPTDKEILDKFNREYDYYRWLQDKSLKWILDILISEWKDYIEHEYRSFIFGISEEEIYKLFNENSGEKLHKYRRLLLYFKNISNATNEEKDFTDRVIRALQKFNNCPINRARLQSYGILTE